MKNRLKRRARHIEQLESRYVLDSTVVFSEIMYNPPVGDDSLEWIELHNQMAVKMDISGWTIRDGVEYKFPDGTTVDGGGYVVVAADPGALADATGVTALGPFRGSLSNTGERLVLSERSGREMNVVEYNDRDEWPAAADGSGASLAKSNQNANSSDAENWTFSPQVGGTPGAANFSNADEPPTVEQAITFEDEWRYEDSNSDLGTAWRDEGFDDAAWTSGTGLFYADDGKLAVDEPELISVASVSATTAWGNRVAGNLINGSGLNGEIHDTNVDNMWLSNNDSGPELTFDLGSVQSLSQMRVWNYAEYRPDLPGRLAELLGRSARDASILISSNGVNYTNFLDTTFTEITAGNSTEDFSDIIDLQGTSARFVRIDIHSNYLGKDYNDPGSDDGFQNFTGLSEVQFFTSGDSRETELSSAQTHYFRKEFTLTGAPERTELVLNTVLDDGAVFYINGQEVHRDNMPPGAVTFGTAATTEVGDALYSGAFTIPNGGLVQGTNVLAVEVHQAADTDMDFTAELTAIISPFDATSLGIPIAFNEVAGAAADEFQLELVNHGDRSATVGGFVIQSTSGASYTLPAQSIAVGGYLALNEAELGFSPSSSETLFLYNAAGDLVIDGIDIRNSDRARLVKGTGDWLRPASLTPGGENSFALNQDIVINEIMYHHRPEFPRPDMPGTFESTIFMPLDATWKYNRTGDDLGPNWYQTNYAVDDVDWNEGHGLIGVETSALPAPLGTTWTGYDVRIIRYYYQIEFEFAGAPAGADFALQHVVDDGAVFYLNGHELTSAGGGSTRFNMGGGAITNTTLASPGVSNATLSDAIALSVDDLVIGTNVLSVEVHQSSTGSSDTVFGVQLSLRQAITPFVPGTDFAESDEEWIELYNRGATAVDLTGWEIEDAVRYQFADGTILAPAEYLVVARNAEEFALKYPAIDIAGTYDGNLGDRSERILLTDSEGNPADVVQYYDDGRWSTAADAGGASLELRDPFADNSIAESWAPSDEASRSEWRTYTYSGNAASSAVGNDNQWREFVLGMLDRGEVLIDDITVTAQPSLPGQQLIANSTFEGDTVGGGAAGWRFLGNHQHSEVIVDPDDPTNQVMRVVATGATEHMHNHINTTLLAAISNGQEYEISYRAKWISGAPLLHSRLYFNRLARATTIEQPEISGTPGAQNSTFVANIGPTYTGLQHSPAVPEPNQPITVSVVADDPHGVASLTLWYSIQGGAWQSTEMTSGGGDGKYSGIIPGQAAAAIVQFYVEGTDGAVSSATSTFPAMGRDSRALLKINDGLASDTGIHNLRIIVTPEDANWMHTDINLMSNDRVPATVIYDESEIFYDVGVRLSGSQRARPFQPRLSFNVRFNQDHLFRGVHQTMALDRSDSTGFGQREILLHHSMGQIGGVPAEYNDLVHIMTPRSEHTGGAEMQLARYTNVFLDTQYNNGGDGRLYEYELVYYPTTADAQGFKRPQPDSVSGTTIHDLGDDKERYRWTFLIKNNRDADDYAQLIEWAKVMGTSGATFDSSIGDVVDVDQWLSAASFAAASGFGDQYGAGSQHNAQFYVNPNTGLVEFFPHDLDAFFNAGNSILPGNEISKIVNASPQNQHFYYGYMHHFVTTTYNTDYMREFSDDFKELLPAQSWDSWLSGIGQRNSNVISQINSRVPPVNYGISTPSPVNASDASSVTIAGAAWVNVKELRLAGSNQPLETNWVTRSTWNAIVPIDNSVTSITIEAYDFSGQLIGTDTVEVISTATNPVLENLRITEINYNPAAPTASEEAALPNVDNDDFEFVEVVNAGDETISLLGVTFTDGFDFTSGPVTLAAGERGVIVQDAEAFQVRYGNSATIIGEFADGRLSNGGERLELADGLDHVITAFEYGTNDPWPEFADGAGASLQIIDGMTPPSLYGKHYSWRASAEFGGSPGDPARPPATVVVNEVFANSNPPVVRSDSIELLNKGTAPVDIGGWYLSDSVNDLLKFEIPAGTVLDAGETIVFDESHFNPTPLTPGPGDFALSGTDGDDVLLVAADATGVTMFVDAVHFGASRLGESWGRVPTGTGRLTPLSRESLGCGPSSQYGHVGPLVITEIQYNPGEPTETDLAIHADLVEDDLEFIEVHNPTAATVDLTEWRVRGGVDFDFDAGTTITAGETIVLVSFNPDRPDNAGRTAAFRSHYNDTTAGLLGGWSGQLSDSGEEVRLLRPDVPPPDDPMVTPYVTEDAVLYDDLLPWPTGVDGSGQSLTRVSPTSSGHTAVGWDGAAASPGSYGLSGLTASDLTGDGLTDAADIDLLFDEVNRTSSTSALYDLDESGFVDVGDVEHLVTTIMGTFVGDANLDGMVNSVDLNEVGIHWQRAGCLGWADGDYDGNRAVDVTDLNFVGINWQQPVAPAAARVPRAPLSISAPYPVVDVAIGELAEPTATESKVTAPAVDSPTTPSQPVGTNLVRQRIQQATRVRRVARASQDLGTQTDDFWARLQADDWW